MARILRWLAFSASLSACHSSAQVPAHAPSHKSELARRSAADLIEQYVFHPDCGFRTFADRAAYAAALARNQAITAELSRRGEAAAATCRQHLGDLRNIFDGDGGPGTNVASVCHQLLTELGQPVKDKVEFRFCSR
jgi:hypothetical protein